MQKIPSRNYYPLEDRRVSQVIARRSSTAEHMRRDLDIIDSCQDIEGSSITEKLQFLARTAFELNKFTDTLENARVKAERALHLVSCLPSGSYLYLMPSTRFGRLYNTSTDTTVALPKEVQSWRNNGVYTFEKPAYTDENAKQFGELCVVPIIQKSDRNTTGRGEGDFEVVIHKTTTTNQGRVTGTGIQTFNTPRFALKLGATQLHIAQFRQPEMYIGQVGFGDFTSPDGREFNFMQHIDDNYCESTDLVIPEVLVVRDVLVQPIDPKLIASERKKVVFPIQ